MDDIYIWSLGNSKFSYNILNLESRSRQYLQDIKCKESIKKKTIKCTYKNVYNMYVT